MIDVDVLVVGGGPAGLAAAHALGRAGRRTLVLDDGRPRNEGVASSTGIPWLPAEAPARLRDRALAELAHLAPFVRIEARTVEALARTATGFQLPAFGDAPAVSARAVLLATGVRDELPQVPGIERLWGRRAFSCPYCHGHEARGRRVVTMGAGLDIAILTLHVARLTRGDAGPPILITAQPSSIPADARSAVERAGIEIRLAAAARLEERAHEVVVSTDDGELACDVVFTRAVPYPRSSLAAQFGCELDDSGYVVVDEANRTSVEGIYAAGDLVRKPYSMPSMQVLHAAADGSAAGLACEQDLFLASLEALT